MNKKEYNIINVEQNFVTEQKIIKWNDIEWYRLEKN